MCQCTQRPRRERPSIEVRKAALDWRIRPIFHFPRQQGKVPERHIPQLVMLTSRVSAKEALGMGKEQAAAEVHRELVLPLFFEHASRGDVRTFVSHTVCFGCLIQPPEHALPCGHIICTSCLKTHGRTHLDHYVEISACPLERSEKRFRSSWKVFLKPASCGVRILALDGYVPTYPARL